MNLRPSIHKYFAWLLLLSSFGWMTVPSGAAALSIAENPLFLTVSVPPNVVVTLDDSGSMSRAFTPDLCGNPNGICNNNPDSSLDPRYVKSSHYNPIYYNPNVTYTPPVDASGTALTTSFSEAWVDGYAHSLPSISPDFFDLASKYRPSAGLFLHSATKSHQFMNHYGSDVRCNLVSGTDPCQYNSTSGTGTATWVNMESPVVDCDTNNQCQARPMPAYYYVFDGNNSGCTGTDAQKSVDNDCYDIKIVSATSGPGGTDERQNFANWYSFYRTRNLATIASASLAFASLDESTRVSWQSLHTCRNSTSSLVTADCEGWEATATNFSNAIKPFTGTHKQNFYTWLFRLNTNTSTPLREAMQRVGGYYSTTGEDSPYDNDLTSSGSGQLSCRKNFHILMTDGIWNGGITTSVGNADGGLPDPYGDTNTDSLADVAYYYWNTDLTTLANNLTPYVVDRTGSTTDQNNNPRNDPATHQHMVNFTVGLGLTPYLANTGLTWGGDTYSGSYLNIYANTTQWPVTGANLDGNVADLWHAAINSRGQFFSADTPDALVTAFAKVKDAIQAATPSAAALAANSTSIQTGALVYQATFDSKDWSGNLVAYPVGTGGVVGSEVWNAASKMPAPGARQIFTLDIDNYALDGSNGANFNWSALGASQMAYLNTDATGTTDTKGSDRLNWLRGQSVASMRARTSILGDIINSDPVFSHAEDFGYKTMASAEGAYYESYVASKSGRTPAVFVGSNDGMLHAFGSAGTGIYAGVELFAYVPNGVYENLSKLTDPNYAHKYYVDGGPTVGDAYLNGSWTTVLVGGLGGGGKSIYALDVSDVASPSSSMVKWEFTEADMGLSYNKPQIAPVNVGGTVVWAAIFGNGYNSPSEQAYLYVVNLHTGAQIAKIAAGAAGSNGLSTPALHDVNGDKIIDYAYAGDLQGNLWKFDLTTFADQTTPLFAARNASAQVQPVTAQPVIGGHPNGGVLVYFGTGQYLQSLDPLDTKVQTFYGIWDNGSAITTNDRSELQVQIITAKTTEFGADLRETSANSVDWTSKRGWYMDLDQPSPNGERVVTQALLRYDRVIFLTLIPSTDECVPGGESWLMELDAVTGGRTTTPNFDFNNDGNFDSSDYVASGEPPSGIKTTVGITKPPAWFTGTDGKDFKVMTGTTGGIQSLGNRGGGGTPGVPSLRRTYWLQIQ